jgi:hypothetical protein
MKKIIINFIFALLTVGGMTLLTGNAEAEINELESYSLVCQKGLVALDHDIDSFNKLFGTPKSKKVRKLTDPGYEGVHATTVIYQNEVTLIYSTVNGKNKIYELTIGSAKAQKIAGFNAQTEQNVKHLYGVPYREASNALVYGCDNVEITFQTKNGKVLSLDITASDI